MSLLEALKSKGGCKASGRRSNGCPPPSAPYPLGRCLFFPCLRTALLSSGLLVSLWCLLLVLCCLLGILRQDLAWFDREENSTEALTARLGTEVTLVKNITGLNLNRQGDVERTGPKGG